MCQRVPSPCPPSCFWSLGVYVCLPAYLTWTTPRLMGIAGSMWPNVLRTGPRLPDISLSVIQIVIPKSPLFLSFFHSTCKQNVAASSTFSGLPQPSSFATSLSTDVYISLSSSCHLATRGAFLKRPSDNIWKSVPMELEGWDIFWQSYHFPSSPEHFLKINKHVCLTSDFPSFFVGSTYLMECFNHMKKILLFRYIRM